MESGKKKKLYYQVYQELRSHIIKEQLKPGDKLPTENELCEILGVSRNVLREAIKALEIVGVISSKAGVGMVLNPFNSSFISSTILLSLLEDGSEIVIHSQKVRKVLELGFSRESFDSLKGEDIGKLDDIIEETRKLPEKADFYSLDEEFHKILFCRVDNPVLMAFIESAWECSKEYKTRFEVDTPQMRLKKHEDIVNALKAKDYQAYYNALDFHFSYDFLVKKEEI